MELKEDTSKGEKPKQIQSLGFKPKGNFIKKGVPFKANQPKGREVQRNVFQLQ
jgi:hypothetical protein